MPIEYYIKLVLTLTVLFVILVVVLKFTKTMHRKRYSGDIKIMDRMPIETNVSLLIVQIRGTEYLIGVGAKEVKLLKKL